MGLSLGAMGNNEPIATGGYMEGNQRKTSRKTVRVGPERYNEGL